MPVAQVHQGEADGGAEEPVESVEHGVPVGEGGVVRLDLAQNLRGEDEEHDDDLQRVGQVDLEPALQDCGEQEQDQCQDAEEHVFKVPVEELGHHDQDDQQAQHQINGGDHALSLQGLVGRGQKLPFFLDCLPIVSPFTCWMDGSNRTEPDWHIPA